MSRACAAKLVTKSSVGGEPAMAARTVPPWAGHLSMAAPHAPDAVNIVSATLAVISLRSLASPLLSVTQEPPDAGGDDVLLSVVESHGIERQSTLAQASLVEVDRRHTLAKPSRDLGGLGGRRENELDERHAPRRLAWEHDDLDAIQPLQCRREALAAIGPLLLVFGLLRHERLESNDRSGNLLLADLEAAAEAVPGDPIQGLLHELLRRHPRGRRHIHVHLLEQGGCDELSATEEKAAGLRPPECLASAHGHEVGAFRDEAREVLHRGHLIRGIHDERH